MWPNGHVRPGVAPIAALWSSRANSTVNFQLAFYLLFDASGVAPPSYDNRWYGFPLRCLVR